VNKGYVRSELGIVGGELSLIGRERGKPRYSVRWQRTRWVRTRLGAKPPSTGEKDGVHFRCHGGGVCQPFYAWKKG